MQVLKGDTGSDWSTSSSYRHFSLSPCVALDYVIDGDTDRRLRGQVPRVTFLSRTLDEPKHQASGTVRLKYQHDRVCGDAVFRLQVDIAHSASEGRCRCMTSSLGVL